MWEETPRRVDYNGGIEWITWIKKTRSVGTGFIVEVPLATIDQELTSS